MFTFVWIRASMKLVVVWIVIIFAGGQQLYSHYDYTLKIPSVDSAYVELMLDYFLASAAVAGDSGCMKHIMYCKVLERYLPPDTSHTDKLTLVKLQSALADSVVRSWRVRRSSICEIYEQLREEEFLQISLKDRHVYGRIVPIERQIQSDTRPFFRCSRVVATVTETESAMSISDFFRCKFTSILELLQLSCM